LFPVFVASARRRITPGVRFFGSGRVGVARVVDRARAVVGNGPTYISFDVDGLDPAHAPGTGTPEAGGLTPREAQAILHGLAGIDIVGGDVVEVAPQYDPTSNTAMVGGQMLFELFSLWSSARASTSALANCVARRAGHGSPRAAPRSWVAEVATLARPPLAHADASAP
jgi:hypothetical protein